MSGSGKTTLARELADGAIRDGWWCWVHDPNDDYVRMGPSFPTPEAFIQASERGPVPPCVRFQGDPADLIRIDNKSGSALPGGIAAFSNFGQRPTFLLVDESSIMDDDKRTRRQLQQLINRRRHFGLGLIFVVQVPTDLSKNMTSNATEAKIFRTIDNDHLVVIRRRFNLPPETMERIPHLAKGEYVTVSTRPPGW